MEKERPGRIIKIVTKGNRNVKTALHLLTIKAVEVSKIRIRSANRIYVFNANKTCTEKEEK